MALKSGRVVDLETPLPEKIYRERRKNEQQFSNMEIENEGDIDLNSLDSLVEGGDKKLAISILERWLTHNDGEEELEKLVSLFDESIDSHISISWCKDLIEIKPKSQSAWCRLLELHSQNNDSSSAFEAAIRIVELDPDSVQGNVFLSNYHLYNEDWVNAIYHSERCISQDPMDSEALRNIAKSHQGNGNENGATDAWEKWSNSNSSCVEDYISASEFFLSKSRFAVSATISSRGIEIENNNIPLLELLILAYSSLDEWSLCLEVSKKLSLLDRNNSIAIWHRKKSNFNLGITLESEENTNKHRRMWFSILEKEDSENDSIRWFNLI